MNRIRVFWSRFLGMFRRRRHDGQLAEELAFHLQTEIDRQLEAGLTPDDARRTARKKFGGVIQVTEACREARSLMAVETVVRDVRYALRGLAHSPGFGIVAVLSLALGIGGTTAVFTLMDPLVLKPLPVVEPDRLVSFETDRMDLRLLLPNLSEDVIRAVSRHSPVSYAELDQLVSRSNLFSGTFDYTPASANFALRTGDEGPPGETTVVVAEASGEFFSTLGVGTSLGRPFLQSDAAPGQPPVVVISDSLWRNRFGGAPDVIGRSVTLIQSPQITRIETPATIIGVAVPGFDGIEPGTAVDVWKPSVRVRGRAPGPGPQGFLTAVAAGGYAVGRLRPGVSLEAARAEIDGIFQQVLSEWAAEFGADWTTEQRTAFLEQRMTLHPASQGWTLVWGRLGQPLIILMIGVSCLLLIGCANVGALLLARGESRRQELTLRMALGGGRIRLIRQLLTESLTLAVIGGVTGLACASWAVRLLLVSAPEGPAIAESVALNGRALVFATVAGLLSVVLFGVIPAVRTTRLDVHSGLQGTADRTKPAPSHRRVGRLLIVSQLALSLVLLVGAGLFVETLRNLRETETGFDRQQVIRLAFNRPTPPYPEVLDRIGGLPGIQSATVSNDVGLLGSHAGLIQIQADEHVPASGESMSVVPTRVGLRFFETMGIRLRAGRTFRPEDVRRSGDVAVISETTARRLFGDWNPVGRRFSTDAPQYMTGGAPGTGRREVEVLGVVEDVVSRSLREEPPASAYFLLPPTAEPDQFSFAVRASSSLSDAASAIRRVVASGDSAMRIARMQTMDEIVEATIAPERFLAHLATAFGVLAMALAAVGLYGTLSFGVAQRTREIGVRMALGARMGDVLRLTIGDAAWTVSLGLILGLGGALAATQAVKRLLFGVAPTSLPVIAAAVLVLIAASAVAAYLPARRASRVDPLVALRHD